MDVEQAVIVLRCRFLGSNTSLIYGPERGQKAETKFQSEDPRGSFEGITGYCISPILGTSKRCCHICANNITALSSAEGSTNTSSIAPVSIAHSTVYPCVLPSLLQVAIRGRVVRHYQRELGPIVAELLHAADAESPRQELEAKHGLAARDESSAGGNRWIAGHKRRRTRKENTLSVELTPIALMFHKPSIINC